MNKKRNFLVLTAAAISGLLIGCSNFLDKQPNGVEIREGFFTNADQAERGLIAAYDAIAWYYSQEVDEWQFGDICSDDAEKGGESAADFADLQHFKDFNGKATFGNLELRWQEYYQAIYRANGVINNVPNIAMDATARDRIVGEAKFIRGYVFFQLVKTFGEIPLILKELELGDLCHPKNSMAECWAQIEKDLSDAAAVLPEKTGDNAPALGRATKGAANAFLVKAYVFQKKWTEAQTTAEVVINSGIYDLEPDYTDIWKLSHENGIESIFDIQHTTVNTSNWGDGNEGQVTTIYTSSRTAKWYSGWGFHCPTQDLYDEYEENDPRREASILVVGDTMWAGTADAEVFDGGVSPTKMHARKYMLEHMETKPDMSNAPANWRAMRYADLLLMHAEAANENNNSTAALESLNKVRARVGLPAETKTDQAELRTAIYHERRVELALEGHRFFDLVRQGRAADVLKDNGFVKDRHEYFPIPQSELDACPALTQNSYYGN